MTELEKDLEKAIKELAISVKYPGCIWVDTEIPEQQVEISVSNIAARLAELGYVKVVRCKDCQHWGGNRAHVRECPVCAGWLEKGMALCYGRFIENIDGVLMKADEFCQEGERVEKGVRE